MRRKEREIKDLVQIIPIIEKCQVIHLAMVDDQKPYVVPMNFGYMVENEQLTLYFHSAKEGRKMDILRKNPQVCFEMEHLINIAESPVPCKWTAHYESVIGEGKITFIEEANQKERAMSCIMRKYGFEGEMNFHPEAMKQTQLHMLVVDQIVAKGNYPD